MRVLLIGDNSDLSKKIVSILSEHTIDTDILDFSQDPLHLIQTTEYKLIILSSIYPDSLRIGSISNLREQQVRVPIMLLSIGLQWHDKVTALGAGADACLEFPCPADLLVAYVKAVIRRDQFKPSRKMIHVEHLHIDTRTCSLTVKGAHIHLTADEYRLLLLLAEHVDSPVSRAQISQALHDHDSYFDRGNVPEVIICKIRKKINSIIQKKYIKTVQGVGYMLSAAQEQAKST